MPRRNFDWDRHFSAASFKSIRSLSPDLCSRRLPSCFSPDRSYYYISPLDTEVRTDNAGELKTQLKRLGEDFHSLREDEYARRYIVHVDFTQVCLLLSDLEGDDNNYGLPDVVLKSREYSHNEDGKAELPTPREPSD